MSVARESRNVGESPIHGRTGELRTICIFALAEQAGGRTLFGEAFEYRQTVPFFALFTVTLHANPPVGDVETLRRFGTSDDLRYWVVRDLQAAIHAAATRKPLAILLEDIHWSGNATLLTLRSLAATPPDALARTGAANTRKRLIDSAPGR